MHCHSTVVLHDWLPCPERPIYDRRRRLYLGVPHRPLTMRVGIVGNGVAAVTAATEILRLDPSAEIHIFSGEPRGYYQRPRLIELLAGRANIDGVIRYGPEWYESRGIHLHLGVRVTRLDRERKELATDTGGPMGFDRVLIATGGLPFVPPIEGTDKKGIFTIRTLDDAIAIREWTEEHRKVLVVGAGVLGIEVAAALGDTGCDVTVVSHINRVLDVQLDEGASKVMVALLKRRGLKVALNFACRAMLGDGSVSGALSTDGKTLDGESVVVATGVRPDATLARDAGLEIAHGIVIDDFAQTSASGIFAAGDCVEWNGVCLGIIPVALNTARVAAQNIVEHGSVRYSGTTPVNALKVAGIDMMSIGDVHVTDNAEILTHSDADEGLYYKAVLRNGRVIGAIVIGNPTLARRLSRLVRTAEPVGSDADASLLFDV